MRCSGITREGGRCERSADGPNGLCWLHDPNRSEDRRRAASRAGKSKPSRELRDLKSYLEDLAEEVRNGGLDPKVGAVVNQIVNTRLRALELERRWLEVGEIEERIERLEEARYEGRMHG